MYVNWESHHATFYTVIISTLFSEMNIFSPIVLMAEREETDITTQFEVTHLRAAKTEGIQKWLKKFLGFTKKRIINFFYLFFFIGFDILRAKYN